MHERRWWVGRLLSRRRMCVRLLVCIRLRRLPSLARLVRLVARRLLVVPHGGCCCCGVVGGGQGVRLTRQSTRSKYLPGPAHAHTSVE